MPKNATSPQYPKTIGCVAELFGVSPALLRVYEQQGLVQPERDSSGRRLYLPDDVERIRKYRKRFGSK